jgi:hypothetical protein
MIKAMSSIPLKSTNFKSNPSRFVRPDKTRLKKALGDLNVNCDPMTKSALSNIYTYWKDIDEPDNSDWLNDNPKDGFGCFENFAGKKVTATRNVLYIQPLVYISNSVLTESLKSNLKKWLEAQFQPCKVEILPNIFKDVLDNIPLKLLGTQKNCNGEKQYNAIGILNNVIGPI